MDKTELLSAVKKEIVKFLNKHNGYSNGYGTFIEGTVEKRVHRCLYWATPEARETMTVNQMNNEGSDLNDKLLKLLEKTQGDDWTIEIKRHYVEDGCFHTYVRINEPYTRISI
jgi:hypothetical protein